MTVLTGHRESQLDQNYSWVLKTILFTSKLFNGITCNICTISKIELCTVLHSVSLHKIHKNKGNIYNNFTLVIDSSFCFFLSIIEISDFVPELNYTTAPKAIIELKILLKH